MRVTCTEYKPTGSQRGAEAIHLEMVDGLT